MATIAIAGAGVVGRLLAWTLAQAGHAVQVVDPAPGPDAPDQSAGLHPGREGAEGLVGLEGEHRQVVQRGARMGVQMPQRVPLHERHAERAQQIGRAHV